MIRGFKEEFRQALDCLKTLPESASVTSSASMPGPDGTANPTSNSKDVISMSDHCSRSVKSCVLALLVCCLNLAMTAPARAGFVSANEIMMSAEQSDAAFLGGSFGPDGNSPLSFTSNVNSTANTFSYTSVAGSTYLGQSFSDATSGFYDATNSIWNWTSAGSLGATSWTLTGSETITGDPTGAINVSGTYKIFMYNAIVTYDFGLNGISISSNISGIYSILGFKAALSGSDAFSVDFTSIASWLFAAPNFSPQMMAPMAPLDGPGDFTILIPATVPEPNSCILMGCGLASVLALGRRRRGKKGGGSR